MNWLFFLEHPWCYRNEHLADERERLRGGEVAWTAVRYNNASASRSSCIVLLHQPSYLQTATTIYTIFATKGFRYSFSPNSAGHIPGFSQSRRIIPLHRRLAVLPAYLSRLSCVTAPEFCSQSLTGLQTMTLATVRSPLSHWEQKGADHHHHQCDEHHHRTTTPPGTPSARSGDSSSHPRKADVAHFPFRVFVAFHNFFESRFEGLRSA